MTILSFKTKSILSKVTNRLFYVTKVALNLISSSPVVAAIRTCIVVGANISREISCATKFKILFKIGLFKVNKEKFDS